MESYHKLKQNHQDLFDSAIAEGNDKTEVPIEKAKSELVNTQSETNWFQDQQSPLNSETSSVNEDQHLLAEESRSSSSVPLAVYWQYFLVGGGYTSVIILALSFVISGALSTGSDYWLNIWTNAEQNRVFRNVTDVSRIRALTDEEQKDIDTTTGIYIYSALIFGVFVFGMIRTFYLYQHGVNSSVNLHNQMLLTIVRAPVLFFDSNPVGKTLSIWLIRMWAFIF